jgi:hypothetical protein
LFDVVYEYLKTLAPTDEGKRSIRCVVIN